MSDVSSLEQDLRAIDTVNRRDVEFALANDVEQMTSQWTEDIVLLQHGVPIMRGRAAIAEAFRSVQAPKIVDYVLDIVEVNVVGDYAFQWGTYRYRMLPTDGKPIKIGGKIMRILQRQPDGAWKIHRGMTTVG